MTCFLFVYNIQTIQNIPNLQVIWQLWIFR